MVEYRKESSVAILEVNNPPVNALSHHVRVSLKDGLERANKESDVRAIVLCGKKQFLAGADIREFSTGSAALDPILKDVCDLLEASSKPVVSAIEGFALGGGLEVAISTHYRVSHAKSMFGFPEVDIGLFPAATGTQRFPRLAGLKVALDVIPSGRRFNAASALKYGVIDKVVEKDVVKEAISFARSIIDKDVDRRRTGRMNVKDIERADQLREEAIERINKKNPGLMAPLAAIKATMWSVSVPFQKACDMERDLALELMTSGQARALQYAFFAQRKASQWSLPDGTSYKNTKALPIRSVGVVGAGTMGSGIAMAALNVGLSVVLLEQDQKYLDAGVKLLRGLYDGSVRLGLISRSEADKRLQLLKPTTSYTDLSNVDLVVEAVYENLALKKEIFKKLDEHCKPDAILASNTSALSIDEMAEATRRPGNVIGIHFFVPAYYMKLLENIRGKLTSPVAMATAAAFGQRLGKVPVLVGNCYGFVANRILRCMANEVLFLLEEGCFPEEVDQVAENFGFPLGHLKVADLSGLDIRVRQVKEIAEREGIVLDERTRYFQGERFSPLLLILSNHNRLGRKTGGGWYNYDSVNAKIPRKSTFVSELLVKYRKENNIPVRRITPQECYERLYYSAINEGFKILEEGIASKPEEIDTVMLLGLGWPRQTGGPMFYAQTVGLRDLYNRILYYNQQHATTKHWRPSALMKKLADEDIPFSDWHRYSPYDSSKTLSRL